MCALEAERLRKAGAVSTKFTPGPWTVEPYREDHPDTSYFVVGADGSTVCVVENQQDNGVYYEPCSHDARLIAAAPRMYEALKRLRSSALIDLTPDQQMEVDIAIAQAEGA